MDLATLREAVIRNLGGSPSVEYDSNMASDVLTAIFNETLQLTTTVHDWPWLDAVETLTTVSGTDSYTPGATWVRTRELQIDTYEPLTYTSYSDLDTRAPVSTATGIPSFYTVFAGALILRPTPNAVLSIRHRFVRTEPTLTDDSDTPLIPSRYHGALVAYATMLACRRLRRSEGNEWANDWVQWLKRMEDDQRRARAPGRVRIRPGLWDAAG